MRTTLTFNNSIILDKCQELLITLNKNKTETVAPYIITKKYFHLSIDGQVSKLMQIYINGEIYSRYSKYDQSANKEFEKAAIKYYPHIVLDFNRTQYYNNENAVASITTLYEKLMEFGYFDFCEELIRTNLIALDLRRMENDFLNDFFFE